VRNKIRTFLLIILGLILLDGINLNIVHASTSLQNCLDSYNKRFSFSPPPGVDKCNDYGLPLNYSIWQDQGLVVYGDPTNIVSNDFSRNWKNPDENGPESVKTSPGMSRGVEHPYYSKSSSRGEYRYHGFDKKGGLVNNSHFPDDVNGKPPSERQWIYRPWNSEYTREYDPRGFSQLIHDMGLKTLDGLNQELVREINSIIKSDDVQLIHTTDTNKDLFNYMKVESDPTLYFPGSGTMRSLGRDNKVYYQTFSVNKLTGKKVPPVSATIRMPDGNTSSARINRDDYLGDTVDLMLRLSGSLADETYFNDRYKKMEYFTRLDHQSWKLELSYANEKLVIPNANITRKDNTGYADVTIKLKKSLISGPDLTMTLKATETFNDSDAAPSGTTTFKLIFDDRKPNDPIPNKRDDEDRPDPSMPDPIICTPIIPNDAFDIVAFPASDATDLSKIGYRTVFVDGEEVDADLFFSGRYVFGEGKHGLRQVSIKWERADNVDPRTHMQECDTYRWVNVHDTKPKAQFTFNGGTQKENRKMSVSDVSASINDPFVIAHYPITDYRWEWEAIGESADADRRMGTDGLHYKEFLFKKQGTYRLKLTVSNGLGRVSDTYPIEFSVIEDAAPAIILYPYNSQIARNEKVYLKYDAASIDGDVIADTHIEVYYDSDNDNTFDTLLDTFYGPISEYVPKNNQLGQYKIVATVTEGFGQDTLPAHITEADRRSRTFESVFYVDNYMPYSDIYSDVPYLRPQVDIFFMLDKNLSQSKIDYMRSNGVTLTNKFKSEAMDAQVQVWDMHTYVYSEQAQTVKNTGGSYPPETITYTSGKYSGTLTVYNRKNNPYNQPYSTQVTVVDRPAYTEAVPWCKGWGTDEPPQFYDHPGSCHSGTSTGYSKYIYHPATYKTVTEWHDRWYDSWTGYYSGTIYQNVRQPYTNPYSRTTSKKYIVYMSDDIVNEMTDFVAVKNKSDADIILVGNSNIRTQSEFEAHLDSGQPIEQVLEEVVQTIAERNPPISSQIVLLNDPFNLYTIDLDDEKDPIVNHRLQIVQDTDYFDNPMGLAPFASDVYKEDGYDIAIPKSSYLTSGESTDNPFPASVSSMQAKLPTSGKYTFYRLTTDSPSEDPNFASYAYDSNESRLNVIGHRKPIAKAKLDWYFTPSCVCYRTNWIDESYDLDHEFSDPNKGIIEQKARYRKDRGEWMYAIPDYLEPGVYELEYVVKDIELAWSDPFVLNFTLDDVAKVQLDAKARAQDSAFTIDSIPASENLLAYDIWTRYPFSHSLQLYLEQNGAKRTNPIYVGYYTGTKNGDDIDWEDVAVNVPETLPDGNYMLKLDANGMYPRSNASKSFPVTVMTPIRLTGSMDSADQLDTTKLIVSNPVKIHASTTKYANKVSVTMYKGTSYQQVISLDGSVTSSSGYGAKSWTASSTVPRMPDGKYTFEWRATTPNGNVEVLTKYLEVVNNRPPIADFDWSPKPVWEGDAVTIDNLSTDPDGDALSSNWSIKKPDGSMETGTSRDMEITCTEPGNYVVTLTVSDGKASATVTKTIIASPLTIEGAVQHTPEWRIKHAQAGHETVNDPKDFYSGEIFVVAAEASPAEVQEVKAWLSAVGLDGSPIEIVGTLELTEAGSMWFKGQLYDPILQSMTAGLPEGVQWIHFRIIYGNGVMKEMQVPVNIIGNVNRSFNVHRVQ